MQSSRRQFAWKRRRLIWNNDGNDLVGLGDSEPATPEAFYAGRFAGLEGSQVDAVCYCTGVFNHYTHRSDVSEVLRSDLVPSRRLHELHVLGTDSLELAIRHSRQNGREIFWSMRMNDTHDSGRSPKEQALMSRWKREHPECLIAPDGTEPPYAAGRWSALDYGHHAVREQVLRIIDDVLSRYDVDGIELDFFRHPHYFRPQFYGEPVEDSHRLLMNGLVAEISRAVNETAARRGRSLLVLVRVPDSVAYCRAIGLDVECWIRSGWADAVIGGGYFHLQPWKSFCGKIRQLGVPVYACLDASRLVSAHEPEANQCGDSLWACEAALAWQAADGIHLFNRFQTNRAIFRTLGQPGLLGSADAAHRETALAPGTWSTPGRWLKDGDQFMELPE
ncbi:MAG: hypothetical protein SFU53_14170 [Terrimicrobiaceae bacterium]|nr:hypothetical protein [Terrimicrobiaceae bacterium]